MVIKLCKKGNNRLRKCKHLTCIDMSKSDVMSDSLFTFLSTLSKSQTQPSHRKVFLTIKQYKIKDIYPSHPDSPNDPTHILIFSLRWIAVNKFQPIGGILFKPEKYTGKVTDLGKTLGEFIKAYLWSINMVSLTVVAIISPPDDYFKIIIRYLTKSNDFETGESPITFYSEQFKNVSCIFEPTSVQAQFQKVFTENDVLFYDRGEHHCASWNHIKYLMNFPEFETFRNRLNASDETSVFMERVQSSLFKRSQNGDMMNDAYASAVLINSIRNFLKFLELEVVSTNKLKNLFSSWNEAIRILESLSFKPSSSKTTEIQTLLLFLASIIADNELKKDVIKENVENSPVECNNNDEENADKKSSLVHISLVENDIRKVDSDEESKIKDNLSKTSRKGKENKDGAVNRAKKPYSRPDVINTQLTKTVANLKQNLQDIKKVSNEINDVIYKKTEKTLLPDKKKPYSRRAKKKKQTVEKNVAEDQLIEKINEKVDKLMNKCSEEDKITSETSERCRLEDKDPDIHTSLLSSSKKNYNSINSTCLDGKGINARLKNLPYSRPTKDSKLHNHHAVVKQVETLDKNIKDVIGEPGLSFSKPASTLKYSSLQLPFVPTINQSSMFLRDDSNEEIASIAGESDDMNCLIQSVNEKILTWSDDETFFETTLNSVGCSEHSSEGYDSSFELSPLSPILKNNSLKDVTKEDDSEKHNISKKVVKPYSRPDFASEMRLAQSVSNAVDLTPNTINMSLKECTNLINQMKLERQSSSEAETPQATTDLKRTVSEECISKIEDREKSEAETSNKQYISCIRTMKYAIKRLVDYQIPSFFMESFNCDHTDYFVNLIKKNVNQLEVPAHFVNNPVCELQEELQAISVLDKKSGNLFCLKQ